jgi:hypothetical protein
MGGVAPYFRLIRLSCLCACIKLSPFEGNAFRARQSMQPPARRVERAGRCGMDVWHDHGLPSSTRQHAKIIGRRPRLIGGETMTAGSIGDIRALG